MRYMLLLYGDYEAERALSAQESAAIVEAHKEFGQFLHAQGADVFGEALDSPDTATTLRADGVVTDGPFAEGREQIGGVYVIEAPDLDGALRWASRVPVSPGLSVEVRPLLDFSESD